MKYLLMKMKKERQRGTNPGCYYLELGIPGRHTCISNTDTWGFPSQRHWALPSLACMMVPFKLAVPILGSSPRSEHIVL